MEKKDPHEPKLLEYARVAFFCRGGVAARFYLAVGVAYFMRDTLK